MRARNYLAAAYAVTSRRVRISMHGAAYILESKRRVKDPEEREGQKKGGFSKPGDSPVSCMGSPVPLDSDLDSELLSALDTLGVNKVSVPMICRGSFLSPTVDEHAPT